MGQASAPSVFGVEERVFSRYKRARDGPIMGAL